MASLLRMIECGRGPVCVLEMDFKGCGAIFLGSDPNHRSDGHSELKLFSEPMPGALLYAAFVKRGSGVTITLLRTDVSARLARPPCIRDGDHIRIGIRDFAIHIRRRIWKYMKKAILLTLLVVAVLAFFVVVRNYLPGHVRASVDQKKAAKYPSQIIIRDQKVMLDEAREEIRQGNIEQARLVLMDVMESDNSPSDATLMLRKIDGVNMENPIKKEDESAKAILEQARTLYFAGLASMDEGDVARANRIFADASVAIKKSNASAVFTADLARAQAEASERMRQEIHRKIARVDEIMEMSKNMDAAGAAASLMDSYAGLKNTMTVDMEDGLLSQAMTRIKERLEAALQRWIAGGREIERLSGCDQASKIFDEIRMFIDKNGLEKDLPKIFSRAFCMQKGGENALE